MSGGTDVGEGETSAQGQRGIWLDVCLALLLMALATYLRARLLPGAFIGADSLDPFWRSWRILQGTLSPPLHVPESGYALYYSLLPAVAGAGSLQGAFAGAAALHAAIAPLAFLGARVGLAPLLPGGPAGQAALARGAGIFAGLTLALSSELADTLVAGARTYLGASFTTLMAAGILLALGGRAVGLYVVAVASAVALMHHPFALPFVLGALALTPALSRLLGRGHVLGALALGGLVALPRGVQLLGGFVDQGLVHGEALRGIATSNSLLSGIGAQLERSFHDAFFAGEPQVAALMGAALLSPLALILGWGVARRSTGARALGLYGAWVGGSILALGGLALGLGYVQHYHFRLALGPLSLSLGAAGALLIGAALRGILERSPLARLVVLPLLAAPALMARDDAGEAQLALRPEERIDRLQTHGEVAAALIPLAFAGPLVLDAVHVDTQRRFFTPGPVLDLLLRGHPETAFPTRPEATRTARFCVALVAPEPLLTALSTLEGAGETIYTLPDQRLEEGREGGMILQCAQGQWALARWGQALCARLPEGAQVHLGSAYNYMGPLDAELRSEWVGAWWPECLKAR